MKYYGKEKCRILKQIRAEIARQNDIAWTVEECSHKGNCRGTCPRCEAEVVALEKALERRQAVGKTVAVVGIAASMVLSVTGCASTDIFDVQGMEPDPTSVTQSAASAPHTEKAAETDSETASEEQVYTVIQGDFPEDTCLDTEPIDGEMIDEIPVMGEPVEEAPGGGK